jgi:hypothetical protein
MLPLLGGCDTSVEVKIDCGISLKDTEDIISPDIAGSPKSCNLQPYTFASLDSGA